ncbi:gliding motility-associated C-terminal domain-containing protein [Tenacibaculum pacificus]|uniref:T9SS type B sorting domain-containing protein n=1 Tax=Tenacibaculum pacificus TaxID=3018314 RepID=UPI0022F3A90D|nr:gliding motility-associated C-terminal domain-containing protein [Tenacibaculum pacificus]WBX72548.1 gliding motility-associated C-terminal domain-containing protein [Tenacibaculum pacificus]
MLYKASQISASGAIKGLAFFADCRYNNCNFDTAKNQKIYLKEVDFSQIEDTSAPDLSTFTKVYDGEITWRRGSTIENSKTQIVFASEFNYTGSKNLLVYFSNENDKPLGGFGGCGSSPSFLWDNAGEKTVLSEVFKKGEKTGNGNYSKELPIVRFYFDEINTEDFSASVQKTLITASPKKITANGVSSSVITVQLYNANGAILNYANQKVVLNTTAGILGSVVDKNNGSYTAFLTSSEYEETAVISGILNEVNIIDTEEVQFIKKDSSESETGGNPTNNSNPTNLVQGFSPNNDGINDTWKILPNVQTTYPNNSLFVFNRFGYKVYDAAPYQNNWNGESNGKTTISKDSKLPVGSYYFIFNTGKNEQIFKGWIQINY